MLGVWALNTSTFEIMIAGNEQRFEENFNITEGGAKSEGGKIGFDTSSWFAVNNPKKLEQKLVPGFSYGGTFDPGDDMDDGKEPTSVNDVDPADPASWPIENLAGDTTAGDTVLDYSYLVTYRYWDTAPAGYGSGQMSAYFYRLNSKKNVSVELGGVDLGPFVNP